MDLFYQAEATREQLTDPESVIEQQQTLRLLMSFSQQLNDTATIREEGAAALTLQRRYFDLAALASDVANVIKSRFARIPCVLTVIDEPVHVAGDIERLFRVLYVLVENAHTYTSWHREDEGQVELRISGGSSVQVDIFDNGPGVAPSLLDHIGTPFVRGYPEIPGVGWSLYYVRGVVAAHGGTITFTNRLDGGLHVALTLPDTEGN